MGGGFLAYIQCSFRERVMHFPEKVYLNAAPPLRAPIRAGKNYPAARGVAAHIRRARNEFSVGFRTLSRAAAARTGRRDTRPRDETRRCGNPPPPTPRRI